MRSFSISTLWHLRNFSLDKDTHELWQTDGSVNAQTFLVRMKRSINLHKNKWLCLGGIWSLLLCLSWFWIYVQSIFHLDWILWVFGTNVIVGSEENILRRSFSIGLLIFLCGKRLGKIGFKSVPQRFLSFPVIKCWLNTSNPTQSSLKATPHRSTFLPSVQTISIIRQLKVSSQVCSTFVPPKIVSCPKFTSKTFSISSTCCST